MLVDVPSTPVVPTRIRNLYSLKSSHIHLSIPQSHLPDLSFPCTIGWSVSPKKKVCSPKLAFPECSRCCKTFFRNLEHTLRPAILGEHFWKILTGRILLAVLLIGECALDIRRLGFFGYRRNPASNNLPGWLTAIGQLSKESIYQKSTGRVIKGGMVYGCCRWFISQSDFIRDQENYPLYSKRSKRCKEREFVIKIWERCSSKLRDKF